MDDYRALGGLRQKYYLHDSQTGEYGGLRGWRSPENFAASKQTPR